MGCNSNEILSDVYGNDDSVCDNGSDVFSVANESYLAISMHDHTFFQHRMGWILKIIVNRLIVFF